MSDLIWRWGWAGLINEDLICFLLDTGSWKRSQDWFIILLILRITFHILLIAYYLFTYEHTHPHDKWIKFPHFINFLNSQQLLDSAKRSQLWHISRNRNTLINPISKRVSLRRTKMFVYLSLMFCAPAESAICITTWFLWLLPAAASEVYHAYNFDIDVCNGMLVSKDH